MGWKLTPGVEKPLSEHRPVLAITCLRRSQHSRSSWEILVGARTPEANRTHPDVVSVPTMRVSVEHAATWWKPGDPHIQKVDNSANSIVIDVNRMFTQKLGLADQVELGQLKYQMKALGVWQGISYIGNGDDDVQGSRPLSEALTMFNAALVMEAGAELVPPATVSYRPLAWVSADAFRSAVDTRDVRYLGPEFDSFRLCIHGLCIESTHLMLNEPGLDAFGISMGLTPSSATASDASARKVGGLR